MDIEYLFKIIIIGDAGVGKSNILIRYTKNEFDASNKPTIGIEFSSKTIDVNGKKVKLQIWDTAGQERYRAVAKQYYKGASGVMIVYDVTKKSSFENLTNWLDEVKNNAPNEEVSVILVGNKKDLVDLREVTTEEAEAFASENKLFFLETSALDNSDQMIEKVFNTLSEDIIKQKDKDDDEDDDDEIAGGGKQVELREVKDGKVEGGKKKKGCC